MLPILDGCPLGPRDRVGAANTLTVPIAGAARGRLSVRPVLPPR